MVLGGVLDENERDRIIVKAAPKAFDKVEELEKTSQKIDDGSTKSVQVAVDAPPPGFDMKFAGLKKSVVEYKDGKLIAYQPLAEKVLGLLVAAGEPVFRKTIQELFVRSTEFRVSPMWLFWSYIIATLGELCLSPVGLSMVSKMAPAKFATMLMGVWLLTSFFGNFAAGALERDLGHDSADGILSVVHGSGGRGGGGVVCVGAGDYQDDAWGEMGDFDHAQAASGTPACGCFRRQHHGSSSLSSGSIRSTAFISWKLWIANNATAPVKLSVGSSGKGSSGRSLTNSE